MLALAEAAYLAISRHQRNRKNVVLVRGKRANKVAVQRFRSARKYMELEDRRAFYEEMLRALWGYVSDKLSIPVSKLSKDNIEARLTERGVEESLIKDFETVLSEAEFARYAPGNPGETMDKVYSMAMNVITKLEDSIKR